MVVYLMLIELWCTYLLFVYFGTDFIIKLPSKYCFFITIMYTLINQDWGRQFTFQSTTRIITNKNKNNAFTLLGRFVPVLYLICHNNYVRNSILIVIMFIGIKEWIIITLMSTILLYFVLFTYNKLTFLVALSTMIVFLSFYTCWLLKCGLCTLINNKITKK